MLLTLPAAVHPLPLSQPDRAVRELAEIIAEIRGGAASADVEPLAVQVVERATEQHALLLAVVAPPDAAPALLTGVEVDAPAGWDPDDLDSTYRLQDALEDVGGPDVRETIRVPTVLGPAVIVHRVPGPEQVRAGRPVSLQLQAFVPDPATGQLLLLTLACPAAHGWAAHQQLFRELISWITLTDQGLSDDAAEPADGSFEHVTYRV